MNDEVPPTADQFETSEPFLLTRLGPKAWLSEKPTPLEEGAGDATDTFGEQVEWGFGIPSIFRALASPRSGEVFPRAPERGDPLWFVCGYWTCLLHMLIYSLGWARPDLGLWWWYQNGKPCDDPRLRLLSEIFDSDGQLDWFAGWLWRIRFTERVQLPLDEFTKWLDRGGEVPVDPAWIEVQTREALASGIRAPISGDWDPLHLAYHCTGPLECGWSEPLLLHSDPAHRRAAIVLDSMMGWYRALCTAGIEPPLLGDRSWNVEVYVKPTGWLGDFRRSEETGLWFSGSHRFHRLGA